METTFIFKGHRLDLEQRSAYFFYELLTPTQTYTFIETVHLPKDAEITTPDMVIETIMDNLLLILGISYYKLTCAKTIQTPTVTLSRRQASFWNKVYTKGLGEFFYQNNLDYRNLIQFPYNSEVEQDEDDQEEVETGNKTGKILLFFAGGKDSIVSAEILKKAGKEFDLLTINPTPLHEEGISVIGKPALFVKRTLDEKLLELNKQQGFYNGHVPFSAIAAFLGTFIAQLYNYNFIITSNEYSSNFGNVFYLGEEINHQWSKSLEFEKLFQAYIANNITQETTYFSLLRPWHEIKIVEFFSKYPQYFSHFSSCNRNFTIKQTLKYDLGNKWCGECSKCLFVFTLLSAFIAKKDLITIFGKNLFTDLSLLPIWKQLLGLSEFKPFECVGTPEEMKAALLLTQKTNEYQSDTLMQFFVETILPTLSEIDQDVLITSVLTSSYPSSMPEEFRIILNRNDATSI